MLLAGCGSDRVPSKPDEIMPPQVASTQPAARAVNVPYDSSIQIDFATEMDASTMIASNVFLKLDTQRTPITASWNAGARRLTLTPEVPLALRKTYTVEVGPGMRTAEGDGFGEDGWFFQFTTNGARRPAHMRPLANTGNESPFVMLSWDSTEISVGNISYEIWSGPDSASVAARAGTPTATLTRAWWLPVNAWALGQRVYWAITVVNGTIGERFHGAVQSFETLPASTPLDSLIVRASDSGHNRVQSFSPVYPYQTCSGDSLYSGDGYQCWMAFPLGGLTADVKIASARLELYTYDHYVSQVPGMQLILWSSKNNWPRPCRTNTQFPENLPNKDQILAFGRRESGRRILYMSDLLAAHVEASVRRGGFYGYEFVSTAPLKYVSQRSVNLEYWPYIKIHYYRTPPEPHSSNAP